ncbi:MAG: Uma2 family endonuclease [Hyphomonadaceae bacterium]|nr:Uma2 family endonuclease [Hyphomonadaceae bacterium]
MNIQHPFSKDGHRPARFTADAYVQSRALINQLFDKTELLDGVIYEMPADGPRTIEWNTALNMWLVRALPEQFHVVPDKTLKLAEYWAPTPDFHVIPADTPITSLQPADVALLIEVSDTTLHYDLGEKAEKYAEHGIHEYWVIDPEEKCLYAHHLREDGGYGAPKKLGFTDTMTATHIPGLALRMADLPRIS